MTAKDWVIDLIFYLDILMNFWTGYDTGYMIVKKKGMIARHYLKTRFPVDFVATVEWDLLIRFGFCGNGQCTTYPRLNEYASLCRMLKVLRLARVGALMNNLTSHM